MELVQRNIFIRENEVVSVTYPKYLYPNIQILEKTFENKGRDWEKHIILNTYYPIRSSDGKLHFIKHTYRYYTNDINKDILKDGIKFIHNEIQNFMLLNEYHNIDSENIEKYTEK